MKRKVILYGLRGIPAGISICYIITVIMSLALSSGCYYPCAPSLVETMGNEINAVILQVFLSGLLGAAFGAGFVIWEIDNWSISKQTGIYFLIISVVMMPIAYITNWMEHSFFGFAVYFGIFIIIFAVIWLIQYLIWKRKIAKMNSKLK